MSEIASKINYNFHRQKILYLVATLIAVASVPILLLAGNYQSNFVAGMPLQIISGRATVNQIATDQFDYGDEVQTKSPILVNSHGSELVFSSGSRFSIELSNNQPIVVVTAGAVYGRITSPHAFNVDNQLLPVENAAVLNIVDEPGLMVFSGQVGYETTEANFNQTILPQGANGSPEVVSINRHILAKSDYALQIIDTLTTNNILPTSLADLEPPTIKITSPQTTLVDTKQIILSGAAPTANTFTISGETINIDEQGKFNYPLTLNSGRNTFELEAIDEWNNRRQLELELIHRTQIADAEPINTQSKQCGSGTVENQTVCIINNYRRSNQITLWENSEPLSIIADKAIANPNLNIEAELTNANLNYPYELINITASSASFAEQLLTTHQAVVNNDQFNLIGISIKQDNLSLIVINPE